MITSRGLGQAIAVAYTHGCKPHTCKAFYARDVLETNLIKIWIECRNL